MKKLVLSFCLLLSLTGYISAQENYTYLKGQQSPFNGEFNEPRIVDVDSITYIYYENDIFVDYILLDPPDVEEIPGFTANLSDYILVKTSVDGLTDTLCYYDVYYGDEPYKLVRKYANDEKLVYSSSTVYYSDYQDKIENEYVYDEMGRILEIRTTKNHDGGATVMVYDTIKYDYTFKPYGSSVTLKHNTIYTPKDTLLVFHFDRLYETIEFVEIAHISKQYLFDEQNRLIKFTTDYPCPTETGASDDGESACKESVIIDYKYTDNGYEEYVNDVKIAEYRFQSDGYCTEYRCYNYLDETTRPGADSPRWVLASIEKYSYYKDGEIIVKNDDVVKGNAPKVYGGQGSVVVGAENPAWIRIYSFSGSLVKQQQVSAGNHTIPLPKGLYVVTIGQMSYKIRVQ
ncbi:DUF6383 domain-containing protein [Bacteroides sp. OttesenSCG-928-D19]|nr:DUF6383 domain-containing protein [Bacteroides sp. OttesenSCG-928-D19]